MNLLLLVSRFWPLALTLVFASVQITAGLHHEMWRDEIQAWLLARDSAWPWNIPYTIRYEGHPGLWHLILWLPSQLSWNPVWMQVVHGFIATICAWLWFRHAPLPWWARLALPFGYYFLYQYGVIARNYGISALLLFAIAHQLRLRWASSISIGILIALLSHTNVHSMILVMGCLPWIIILYGWHFLKNTHDARTNLRRALIGGLIALLGLSTGVHQVIPPEDSGYAEGWQWEWKEKRSLGTSKCLVQAYIHVPIRNGHSLGGDIAYHQEKGWGWLDFEDSNWAALTILILAAICLIRKPFLLLPFITANIGLWAFFYIKFQGSIRHHGFFVLIWLTLLWVSQLWKNQPEEKTWWWWTRNSLLHLIFLGWCALSILGSWVAINTTLQETFSNGKSAGRYIRDHFQKDVIVTGHHSGPLMSTVVGYAEVPQAYYMGRREWGSYVVWDQQWRQRASFREIYNDLLNLTEEFPEREIVFISDSKRRFYFPGFNFKLLGEFNEPATQGEKYVLYQVLPDS